MAIINLQLGASVVLNASVQPGDIAYYIPANTLVGGFNVNINNEDCVTIGVIKDIVTTTLDGDVNNTSTWTLICNIADSTPSPQAGDFIFFSKSREVNEASIVGYYGKFRFENNSKEKAELFAASCNINISSS
jgi:hypothetical protein